MFIKLEGLSSKKTFHIDVSLHELNTSVLDFLRSHNFPIASSCRGEKICKKCKINGEVLSCALSVAEFLENYGNKIKVDYL